MSTRRITAWEQEIEEADPGLRFDPAPRAILQFTVVVMAAVQAAFFDRLRQRVELLDPLARPGPVRRQKRAAKQVDERRWHGVERQRARRLPHFSSLGIDAVCEAELP